MRRGTEEMSESGIWRSAPAVRNAVSQLTVPWRLLFLSVLSSPMVVQAKVMGSEFGSPTRGEETRDRQLAASGDNSCEQCTAVHTRHTRKHFRVWLTLSSRFAARTVLRHFAQ